MHGKICLSLSVKIFLREGGSREMTVTVLGYRPHKFTSQDSGEVISGTKVYVAYQAEKVEGMEADNFFFAQRVQMPEGFRPNCKVEIYFNRYGKVERVEVLK